MSEVRVVAVRSVLKERKSSILKKVPLPFSARGALGCLCLWCPSKGDQTNFDPPHQEQGFHSSLLRTNNPI